MLFLSPIMAANVDSTNTQQQNSIIENTHETHDIQVLNEKYGKTSNKMMVIKV